MVNSYFIYPMTQEQFKEALTGKTIHQINFIDKDENNLNILSISFADGDLLTFQDQPVLSHPEREAEEAAFYEALNNVPPNGLITFKAKFLSAGLIEREISKKHKELKSNGYGPVRNSHQDYLSYRFDMPEK